MQMHLQLHVGSFAGWRALLVLTAGLVTAPASHGERSVTSLDGSWKFQLDLQNAGHAAQWFLPDARFTNAIRVPGAWQAQGYGPETDKLRHGGEGRGWYQREIRLPQLEPGQRRFLCFGGVHRSAEVWVNGHFLGDHLGYVSPFEFELKPEVAPEGIAVITVCVDSKQRWDVDCLTGCFDIIDEMFTVWGGLWGHVWLETRAAVWLEDALVQTAIDPPAAMVTARLAGQPASATRVQLEVRSRSGALIVRTNAPLMANAAGGVSLGTPMPGARLWSPESPELYTARLSLWRDSQEVDRVDVPFGVREIAVRGSDFYLNGKKLFLCGYGDDAVYPKTMAGPSDVAFHRERLRVAKSYGFNYVRHHSHLLPPEYYAAADEVGMLVSAEFPIAYEEYYRRAKGPALELYQREWVAAIKRLRNHPSIFNWCLGNELWESVPLAPAMCQLARQWDPTRLAIDSDGIWPAGFLNGTKDRATLDYYAVQFDEGTLPLDKPAKHRFDGQPRKPVLSHETGNYVTVPRLSLIDEFQDNFKPFWLLPYRAKLEKLGLRAEADLWSRNSEQLYLLAHKINQEDLRKNPRMSGYTWWLLQDYWTGSNGLLDTYRRPKQIPPEAVRRFNNALVLLQDGLDMTYPANQPLAVKVLISNFSPAPVRSGSLDWRVTLGRTSLAAQHGIDASVNQGELTEVAAIQLPLPPATKPEQLTLAVELKAQGAAWRNDWTAWVFPEAPSAIALPVPLFADPEWLGILRHAGAQPLPDGKLPERAVLVMSQPSRRALEAAAAGACLVCLSPEGVFPSVPNRFKPAWWLGNASDCNAGTVVYDHPVTRAFAPDGWCDAGWYRLLEGAQAYVLDDFPVRPEVLVRGLDVHTVCRSKALLFQASVERGSMLVSGLRLELDAAAPERAWLLDQLVRYAATLPQPKAALPLAVLQTWCAQVPVPEGPFCAGFGRLLTPQAECAEYPSYRGTDARLAVCRQTEQGRALEWETAPVPGDVKGPRLTFVFAGGLGWMSQPKTEGFGLWVNGRERLKFDLARTSQTWSNAEGRIKLVFVPKKLMPEDALGLFYLTLPPEEWTAGQPCALAVRSLGQGSRRWFGLNSFADLPGRR